MFRTSFILVALVASCLSNCPANERPSPYGRDLCWQNTCDHPRKAVFFDFSKLCEKPGYVCARGYLRNSRGICVPGSCAKCNQLNEVFDPICANGGENTCKDLSKRTRSHPIDEYGGCVCAEGYVRDGCGKCVLPEQCPAGSIPPCSGTNEKFECRKRVDDTCENLGRPPQFTTCSICKYYCAKGFARDANGKCIAALECPCSLGKFSKRVPNGDPCPVTCENMRKPLCRCTKPAIPFGCKCNPGYVLNEKLGLCVHPDECPTSLVCGETQVYRGCAPLTYVDNTCPDLFAGNFKDYKQGPFHNCKEQCVCKPGLIFYSPGLCVQPGECCTRNDSDSVFVANPNMCPGGTCEQPNFLECDIPKPPYGCQCKEGYLKTSKDNPKCIKKDLCPCVCPKNY